MTRVLVTGMGIITAIGKNLAENYTSLHTGQSGISTAAHFSSRYASLLPFGEIQCSNDTLKVALNLTKRKGYTRTCLLANKAFEEAILDASLSREQLSDYDTALISASTVGGMCLTDQLYEDANLKSAGSQYLTSYNYASHTLKLVERYHITGFSDTINTACSSSANAILLGVRLIKAGRAARVIVGGVDSLAKYTVNGFNALKILSEAPCKPFDENRNGLNLGEGAAYLVLEADHVAGHKHVYAEVLGYGNSNDAFHPSAMSDNATGATLCMRQAIESAGIAPHQIHYVNAHGTATYNNDEVEMVALHSVFGKVPAFSSTKSYTGHTLGAAGAVEAVFSILSIQHSELFASLNIESPMKSFSAGPVISPIRNTPVDYVLSNSFGFGGNCTSLVLGKVTDT